MKLSSLRKPNPVLAKGMDYKMESHNTTDTMTMGGTINKIIILLGLVIIGALLPASGIIPLVSYTGMIVSIIFTFIIGIIAFSKPKLCPILAPIYAALEGVFLGYMSLAFERAYPGIALQAVLLTFGILGAVVTIYKLGLIKVTEEFRFMVSSATLGIALLYGLTIILRLFGIDIAFIHSSGIIGIAFSLFVVSIATFNLVLDIEYIHNAVRRNFSKEYEWYGAFGLMVTLIWLYIEVIRLLAKLKSRD
ncbi:Bax inhibitor-1/YccA family protein [Clostridiaceae bacterium M8S5]|nr:Bax inhibitor-1/YccA family protein [Clostridiaceae bacterium M8S5]